MARRKALLVTCATSEHFTGVRASGVSVLAEYPHALLIRCKTKQQEDRLRAAEFEIAEVPTPRIQLSGLSFSFANAQRAQKVKPIASRKRGRRSYYLVRFIGPAKHQWLEEINSLAGAIHGGMPGFTFIVGLDQKSLAGVQSKPYVEAITEYRPAMKVAPELRRPHRSALGTVALAAVEVRGGKGSIEQIQIQIFPGESTIDVSSAIREAGGTVLFETRETITALVSIKMIPKLAEMHSVQSIFPHRLRKPMNDRALAIMDVPADGVVGQTALRGSGQVIAIADTGLGTGELINPHQDFRSRVAGLVSFPLFASHVQYSHESPGYDDGPADAGDAHGTHVTGSVLGDGSVARQAGANFSPQGAAPEAQLYFQAIEQRVRWKEAQGLRANGLQVPSDWPPSEYGIYGLPEDDLSKLFEPAYLAGARIHSNSWAADDQSIAQKYDPSCGQVDEFMFRHRDMLILFSAGNAGADRNGDGLIDLGSICPPGTAKNCLTIGASESARPRGDQLRPPSPWDGRWTDRWPTMVRKGDITQDPGGMT
jgi:serine protease AprX